MNVAQRVWASLKSIGCWRRHRFWRYETGDCLCGKVRRVVLHPSDWETIDLTLDPEALSDTKGFRLWGLPHERH